MRCRSRERWISDDLDGSLRPGRKEILEAHLAGCASCREYRRKLALIQASLRATEVSRPAPDFGASLAGLGRRLRGAAGEPAGRGAHRAVPRRSARRWAWAGAATALAAAAILVFVTVGRAPLAVEEVPLGFEASLNPIYQDLAASEGLAEAFDASVAASIKEHETEIHDDLVPLLDSQALFLESLSDEEVRLLNLELRAEIVS